MWQASSARPSQPEHCSASCRSNYWPRTSAPPYHRTSEIKQNHSTMNKIAIYTLASSLHDPERVNAITQDFLNTLHMEYELKGNDYTDYGSHALDVIFICTGGTEDAFMSLLPELRQKSSPRLMASTSRRMLAPVVVKPLTVSKRAST